MVDVAAPRIEILRALIEEGEGAWVTCNGSSMEPTLVKGQRVWVQSREAESGDVVVFESKTKDLILHRIAWYPPLSPWFWHVGDAPNPRGPRRARKRKILGVADMPRLKNATAPLVWQFSRSVLSRFEYRLRAYFSSDYR